MHLTLAFLGEVQPDRVPAVARALTDATRGTPALNLEATGLGAFPDSRRARVVWSGVEGDLDRLASLQKRLTEALRTEGFDLDDRPFRPHITLARLRVPQPLPSNLDLSRRFGGWRAGDVELYESRQGPGGVRYEVLAGVGLTEM